MHHHVDRLAWIQTLAQTVNMMPVKAVTVEKVICGAAIPVCLLQIAAASLVDIITRWALHAMISTYTHSTYFSWIISASCLHKGNSLPLLFVQKGSVVVSSDCLTRIECYGLDNYTVTNTSCGDGYECRRSHCVCKPGHVFINGKLIRSVDRLALNYFEGCWIKSKPSDFLLFTTFMILYHM